MPAILLFVVSTWFAATPSHRSVVVVQSGDLSLHAVLWLPDGSGPFPAVVYCHGGGRGRTSPTFESDRQFYLREPDVLGPLFAAHGYAFLYLFRRGAGLSEGQGSYSGDLLDAELAARGTAAMNHLQVRLLETDQLSDALAAIAFVRSLPRVDPRRVAIVGHSFGGSLALITAEHEQSLRAVVDFAGAAASWERSPELRDRLRRAVTRISAPVFFIHAANDYSVTPGETLAAEMQHIGKPHRLKIYPAYGHAAFEGHNFIDLSVKTWEADVFAFLDASTVRPAARPD